jgi:hypothetical protein
MLITICHLYDSYADASRAVLALEAAGVPPSEPSLISNNSDAWYKAAKTENVIPLRKKGLSSETASKVEGAAIGATTATAASLVTMLRCPVSAPDGLQRCWAAWRSAVSPAACSAR